MTGEGEAGQQGAPAGDLYIQMNIAPHAIFTREGLDLMCEIPISFATAAVGGELDVPSLNGKLSVKIPAETQTGKAFRLRGKGIHNPRQHATGDLFCRVFIETPVHLNDKQKKLIHELEESLQKADNKHSPKHHAWLGHVKKYFAHTKK